MDQKLTLYELSQWIKRALEQSISDAVWVIAEISELKEHRNGHCYIELVEKQQNAMVARARATIWSYTYRVLKPYFETTTGQLFTQGIKVLMQVSVEYHPLYGLSLNVKDIDPAYTMGDMALRRKEIIEQLQREGIFDLNRELEMPLVPQRIAVISSATAAGYQDFMDQLANNVRSIQFETRLFEAYMQGAETVPSIIAALGQIFEQEDNFDAVAIIRGGGAITDLSSFDDYDLAFHITQFPLPVVTGIGHQKDDTIIDLVAHTRMKTPTAVAEFFIGRATEFLDRLAQMQEAVVMQARHLLEVRQEQLADFADTLQQGVKNYIDDKNRLLIKSGNRLQQSVSRYAFNKKYLLNNLKYKLVSIVTAWRSERQRELDRRAVEVRSGVHRTMIREQRQLQQTGERIRPVTARLLSRELERIGRYENTTRLLDPQQVLNRGYTLTMKGGRIVKSIDFLERDETIETRFADGQIESIITKKRRYGNKEGELQ